MSESTGARLRRMRAERSMTQEALAENSGVSIRTIRRIEKDETPLAGRNVVELARALGTTVAELRGLDDRNDEERRARLRTRRFLLVEAALRRFEADNNVRLVRGVTHPFDLSFLGGESGLAYASDATLPLRCDGAALSPDGGHLLVLVDVHTSFTGLLISRNHDNLRFVSLALRSAPERMRARNIRIHRIHILPDGDASPDDLAEALADPVGENDGLIHAEARFVGELLDWLPDPGELQDLP